MLVAGELGAAHCANTHLSGDKERPGAAVDSPFVALRICLVTPFAWSQPHDVNEHVAGAARALRALGHQVTVLTPSNRAGDLLAGRRALQDGVEQDVIALGPALPISRRSRIGLPVGRAGEPRARPRAGRVRRRARLRARAAEPVVPRAARHRTPSRSRRSSRRSGSGIRPAGPSASGCCRGSTRCWRPRRRRRRPRRSASPATTGRCRWASTSTSSHRPRSSGSWSASGGRASGRSHGRWSSRLQGAAGLGARPPADEAARRPALDPGRAARAHARADGALG